jgi:hypothetical protein
MRKVEGNVMFYTARSTAFPQPAPAPGPKLVPPGESRGLLGVRTVAYQQGVNPLAVTDTSLAQ